MTRFLYDLARVLLAAVVLALVAVFLAFMAGVWAHALVRAFGAGWSW